MVRNGQSSVNTAEADCCFAESLRRFRSGLAEQAAEIRKGFLERSGLLREPQPDRPDFVHNTLKEYLAGDRFAQLGDTGPLVEHSLDPAWQPSILFAASSRDVGFADRLVERLLDDGGVVRQVSKLVGFRADAERARKVFAFRCGGVALHLKPENRERLNALMQQVSRPAMPCEAEAYAALGDFVVPFLDYEANLPAKTSVACIRALQIIDSCASRERLTHYAADSRKSVVAEYVKATDVVNCIGMRMRLIPAGQFQRESRRVRLTQPFLLGTFPVTQEEYRRVMDGATPSHFKGVSQLPVESVSWLDAIQFCNRLSDLDERAPYYDIDNERVTIRGGDGYRLPTEAQWEYACRAGSTGDWCFGNDESQLGRFVWFRDNSGRKTHAVGQKEANKWGLLDVHGNVWEWCWDWFGDYVVEDEEDPLGPPRASARVIRGGSWGYDARYCRAALRGAYDPASRGVDLGFRVAAVPPGGAGSKNQ